MPELPRGPADPEFESRYTPIGSLGAGGMGEVLLCVDERIGREVAVKHMRQEYAHDPEKRGRFLREARIQARVEHPGLVPVYEMCRTDGNEVWFAMRKLRGETLREVLRKLAAGDGEARRRFGRQRLLAIFSQICRAIAYAHREGVVHRDLKPSNIMLGRFGEVSILDWGVAKILKEELEERATTTSDVSTGDELAMTGEGSSLGTPGYMSPEQALGETRVTEATDVYSLGCILYELLTHKRLNAGRPPEQMARTIKGVEETIRNGLAAHPPELETLCLAATRFEPEERSESAAALADAIDAFLEGDRDLARRRALSAEHLILAEAALEDGDRKGATQQLAQALALDPDNREAATRLTRLFLEPPSPLPKEVEDEHEAWAEQNRREAARFAIPRYVLWAAFWIAFALMGLRMVEMGVVIGAIFFVTLPLCWSHARGRVAGPRISFAIFALSSLGLMLFTQAFSPLLVVPSLAATNVMYFAGHAAKAHRPWLYLVGAATVALPFVGEGLGLLEPTFRVTEAGILIAPKMLSFPPTLTWWLLVLYVAATASIPGLLGAQIRDALARSEKRWVAHNWQLRQIIPSGARASTRPPP